MRLLRMALTVRLESVANSRCDHDLIANGPNKNRLKARNANDTRAVALARKLEPVSVPAW